MVETHMADYNQLRQRSLYSFIGFLALSALVAIGAVLWGRLGWWESRVLITTLTISGVSIDAMGCAVYLERRPHHWLPLTGIVLALTAGVLVIFGAWADIDNVPYWKTAATTTAFAIACTHASLLALVRLPAEQQWLQLVARGTIFLSASLLALALMAEISDSSYYKLLLVVVILVTLFTVVIPLLGRLQPDQPQPVVLQLTQVEADRYRDRQGQLYRLIPLEPETSDEKPELGGVPPDR